jgi:hypothetical protein
MSRFRMMFVSGVIGLLVAAHLFCAWRQQDYWPFAAYPMFAGVNKPEPFTSEELRGVTLDGREVPVTTRQIGVLHLNRVRPSLVRIYNYSTRKNSPDPQAAVKALDGLLDYYALRRERKEHEGPPLAGMKYYRLRWEFDWWAKNRDTPQRSVLFQSSGLGPASTAPSTQPATATAPAAESVVMR